MDFSEALRERVNRIASLSDDKQGTAAWFEAAALAIGVLHDTVGQHPLGASLRSCLESADDKVGYRAKGAARAVVTLYEVGGLSSPRLAVAHEIEGSILDIANAQMQAADRNPDAGQRALQLAIAAFLAGAALEDALRRLADASGLAYDTHRTSIAKLQTTLYQPSKQIEIISGSENKQITAWGDTRNKADHGKFGEITLAEVMSMVVGVRAFIDRHLP